MDRWKAEMGRVREEKRRRKRNCQKKEDPGARKCRKVESRETLCFSNDCGSGGSKSRLVLKRRVRSQMARWEMKSSTPLWREAHFQVKMYKHLSFRTLLKVAKHISKSKCTKHTTFGPLLDVEKVLAVVARSTFRSQKCKLTGTEHFSTLRCRKSARRCGAKHVSKSKC